MATQDPCLEARDSISLTVRCDRTKWGDVVAVVGEGHALGNWSPEDLSDGKGPLTMLCSSSMDDTENVHNSSSVVWPHWVLANPLKVALGETLEYKYVIIRSNGKHKWETQKVGENRTLVINEATLQAGVHDDGEFGCIPCRFTNEASISKTELQTPSAVADRGIADVSCAQHKGQIPAHHRLQRIGKGKQGQCFLVEMEESQTACKAAVLKEFKGGGRDAFQAEVWALSQLSTVDSLPSSVPLLFGADKSHRQVLISYFNGSCLPDAPKYVSVLRNCSCLQGALIAWTQIANALETAHRLGVVHCDVNPWNMLVSGTSSDSDEPIGVSACLVDWACAQPPSDPDRGGGRGQSRRGDFQAPELCKGIVGERTDVYGLAATLMWILVRRTRKGLEDKSKDALSAYFVAEVEQGCYDMEATCELSTREVCDELGSICSWGMEEDYAIRCPHGSLLRERVMLLLSKFGPAHAVV